MSNLEMILALSLTAAVVALFINRQKRNGLNKEIDACARKIANLNAENSLLARVNIRQSRTIADLEDTLKVTIQAMEENEEDGKEAREAFLRQAYAERRDSDIEKITRDIERGMAG